MKDIHEQIEEIRTALYKTENNKWTIQDQLLFEISLFSANRIGALEKLTLSSLNLDNMVFDGIREKEGYRVNAPIMKYCTDNASMVASSAYFFNNTFDNIDVEVFSRV